MLALLLWWLSERADGICRVEDSLIQIILFYYYWLWVAFRVRLHAWKHFFVHKAGKGVKFNMFFLPWQHSNPPENWLWRVGEAPEYCRMCFVGLLQGRGKGKIGTLNAASAGTQSHPVCWVRSEWPQSYPPRTGCRELPINRVGPTKTIAASFPYFPVWRLMRSWRTTAECAGD